MAYPEDMGSSLPQQLRLSRLEKTIILIMKDCSALPQTIIALSLRIVWGRWQIQTELFVLMIKRLVPRLSDSQQLKTAIDAEIVSLTRILKN